MSTDYNLVCYTHKEHVAAASRTAGGYCPISKALVPFIIAHSDCRTGIVSEHEYREYENCREWEDENITTEIEAADLDGRWK